MDTRPWKGECSELRELNDPLCSTPHPAPSRLLSTQALGWYFMLCGASRCTYVSCSRWRHGQKAAAAREARVLPLLPLRLQLRLGRLLLQGAFPTAAAPVDSKRGTGTALPVGQHALYHTCMEPGAASSTGFRCMPLCRSCLADTPHKTPHL